MKPIYANGPATTETTCGETSPGGSEAATPGCIPSPSLSSTSEKAAAYYKAGMLQKAPPFVPATVRVLREQFGDFPFRGAGVEAGEHECQCNRWGAVSVLDRAGKPLGLRLDEFEPLTWRENDKAPKDTPSFNHDSVWRDAMGVKP